MCPSCNKPLVVVEFQGVDLDYCPECRGTWLDAGELELITQLVGGQPGPLTVALCARSKVVGKRRCPRCRRKLQLLAVGETASVHVDRCPSGDGIWLDDGELANVVREFAATGEARLAEFLGDLFSHRLK